MNEVWIRELRQNIYLVSKNKNKSNIRQSDFTLLSKYYIEICDLTGFIKIYFKPFDNNEWKKETSDNS